MSVRLLFAALATVCLFFGSARAQDAEADPIKWALKSAAPQSAKTFTLELTAEIQRGWHLYSTEKVEGGPSPTRITLPAGQNLELAGEIDSPAPHAAYDPNFQVTTESYEGSVTFKIPVKALSAINKIRVQVRYQACTQTICLAPKLVDLETAVGGDATVSAPAGTPELAVDMLTPGESIPDFVFTDFNGKSRSFAEFRGRVVLLDFWASWCSPCLADIPELKNVYQKLRSQGFEIIGMNSETLGQASGDSEFLKSSQKQAREIVSTRGINWTQSINETSLPVAARFGVDRLPAKILIDRQGRFVKRINKVSELSALSTLLETR